MSTRTLQIAEGTRGRPLFQIVAIGLLLTLIGTIGVATASASTNDATIQDPGEISAMMTQASDGIQNKLASQGKQLYLCFVQEKK